MKLYRAIFVLSLLFPFAPPAVSEELEPIRLQLRWHHQFQFAGYYAALQQGYYRDAGFDVSIIAGSPDLQPVNEVLEGRAQFAQGNSEVLYNRLQGKPLVAVAAIFQHSPSVLLTLADSGISRPDLLVNKKVMHVPNRADAGIHAMIHAAGIREDQINFVDSSYQLSDLIEGRIDAFNAYLTNETYFLTTQDIKYHVLAPRDYGIDFYSDILFTSTEQVEKDPARVERFRAATIKGWQYALEHQDEIIELIYYQYKSSKSIEHLRFEARAIKKLIMTDLVEIGHIHPKRINTMAQTFIKQDMVDNLQHLDGFIFTPPNALYEKFYKRYIIAAVICALFAIVITIFVRLTHKLNGEIKQRKKMEEKLAILANTDLLTQIPSRRAFFNRYQAELNRVKRYNEPLSLLLIDLDFFKQVNDNYGHQSGDLVLQHVSRIFAENCRQVDMAARIGGEEFVILLPDTPEKEAVKLAQRILTQVRESNIGPESIKITASIGVAQWFEQQTIDLMACADKALYVAKNSGRDQIISWSKITF